MDKYEESIRQFNEEIKRLKAKDAKEYEMQIKNLELEKEKVQQERYMFNAEMQYKRDQLAAKGSGSDGGSGGGSGDGGGSSNSDKLGGGSDSGSSEELTSVEKVSLDNVFRIGSGPISPAYLNSLVASGQVKETTTSSGVKEYTKNPIPINLGFLNRLNNGKKK